MSECKKSHCGNCHGKVKDGYCLMHRPDKTEEEAKKFYEIIRDQADDTEKIQDYSDLPQEMIEYLPDEKLIFENEVNFKRYVFPKKPINEKFLFYKSIFREKTDFTNSEFKEEAYFTTKFKERAYFTNSKFKEEAYFTNSEFKERAYFTTKFKEEAYFTNSEFKEGAYFTTKFKEKAYFSDSEFKEKTDFGSVLFQRSADLSDTEFEKDLVFDNAYYPHGINIIEDENDFVKKDSDGDSDEPTPRFKSSKAKENACRVQKRTFEDEGRKDEADVMFVHEMRAKREQKKGLKNIWDTSQAYLEWIVADLTCKYGTNWRRILGVSALIISVFTAVFWGGVRLGFGEIQASGSSTVSSVPNLAYYSVVTYTTLGYGDMHPIGLLKAFSALESVIGAVFMAVLVAVFARKWMR